MLIFPKILLGLERNGGILPLHLLIKYINDVPSSAITRAVVKAILMSFDEPENRVRRADDIVIGENLGAPAVGIHDSQNPKTRQESVRSSGNSHGRGVPGDANVVVLSEE